MRDSNHEPVATTINCTDNDQTGQSVICVQVQHSVVISSQKWVKFLYKYAISYDYCAGYESCN